METHLNPEQTRAPQLFDDGHASGVSWGAVFAGAVAAASLSFILLLLGVGLGLSSVSPYSYNTTTITWVTIAWVAFIQLAGSGVGGYIAGRLRLKWLHVHGDEIHFRDTAHGLLAWSVSTLITVALLAGGVKAALGGMIETGTAAATVAIPIMANANTKSTDTGLGMSYYADMLLRSASGDGTTEVQRGEISKIVDSSLTDGKLSAEDRAYLAQTVAKRSGLSQGDAERRVDEIYARATNAAAEAKAKALQLTDEARKTAAHSALWMFATLLLGAFTASLAATLGGRQRDDERNYVRSNAQPLNRPTA